MTALLPNNPASILMSDPNKLLLNEVGDRPVAPEEEQQVLTMLENENRNRLDRRSSIKNLPPINGINRLNSNSNVAALGENMPIGSNGDQGRNPRLPVDSPHRNPPGSSSSRSTASGGMPAPAPTTAEARHERIVEQNKKDKEFYNSLLKFQDERMAANGNVNNGNAPFPGPAAALTAMNPSLAAAMDPHSNLGGAGAGGAGSAFYQPHSSSSLNSSLGQVLPTNPYANPGPQSHLGQAHVHLHDGATGVYAHQHQHQHQHHPDLSISATATAAGLSQNGTINGSNGDPRLLQLRENALLNQHQLNDAHHRLLLGAHQLARNKELQEQEQLSLQHLVMQQQHQQQHQHQHQHQHQGEQDHRLSMSLQSPSPDKNLGDIHANAQAQAHAHTRTAEKKRQLDVMGNGNEPLSPGKDPSAASKRLRIEQHPAIQSLDNTTNALASVLSNDLHSSALTGAPGVGAISGAPSNLLHGGHGQHILEQTALMEHIHRQRILSHHRRMMIDAEMEELLLRHNDMHNHSISASQLQQSRSALLNSSLNPSMSLATSPYSNYPGLMNQQHASAILLHEQAMKKREDLINLSIAGLNCKSNDDALELAVPKKHFSIRPYMHLGTETDEIWLSRFLSFLRLECIEVFTATRTDVFERKTSKKIHINQVGLRCRYCAHLPYRARVVRSSCFPSSICRIYQSLTMMIREHFSRCQEMPAKTREKYTELKWMTKKGEIESKTHWIDSAKSLGMVDTEKGIFLNRPMKLTIPKEPPQPTEEDEEEKSQSPV